MEGLLRYICSNDCYVQLLTNVAWESYWSGIERGGRDT